MTVRVLSAANVSKERMMPYEEDRYPVGAGRPSQQLPMPPKYIDAVDELHHLVKELIIKIAELRNELRVSKTGYQSEQDEVSKRAAVIITMIREAQKESFYGPDVRHDPRVNRID